MDGGERQLNRSLQQNLNRWILSAVLAFSLLAGVVSGWTAFDEARELQDSLLQQVGALVASRTRSISLPGDVDPEDTLVVQRLGDRDTQSLPIPADLPDGLHTLDLAGTGWRVFVYTAPTSAAGQGGRFAVSQQTEVRDEVAWGSSLRTLLPVLLLAPVLMAVVSFAVNRSFLPVRALANAVDKRDENRLDALPDQRVPLELLPFTHSLNRLLERLRQAITQQQRFVADAAHELRTPVTAISLLVENLAKADTLEASRKRLLPVQEGMERLRTLVAHLLNLARLQGENQPEATQINFRQTVQETIAELIPLAEAKSIDLGMLRNENLLVQDRAGNLSVLVRNAVENAIRYTPAGGQVDISLFADDGQAVLQVADTGCGIPQEELPQVFEPFYRVGVSAEPGNGLGLAISQEIAKRLGGSIRLANRKGGGLLFEYCQSLQQ
ncbi:sensor histidine kinase [Thiothrix nivea]|uniref:histidine kinase n=1 Tax=Thiothrix nivea (strain ATCC 35100 / DSM 5205 / JP2) TaxID=870187 RepID=A0A656HCP7_THINJ|nr:ATP-binding protein [Thiothrix nivea]EIJ32929.1 integral membrane sensor signal transduction histidine kinase [Thiothrix nivea DSM 5205]